MECSQTYRRVFLCFLDEDELCVMSFVYYAVGNIYDDEVNAYYVSEGTYSHDPADWYSEKIAYLNRTNIYLEAERVCLEQIKLHL